MLHERNDEELMMLVAQGHKLAFDHLVKRHIISACAIASRISGNIHEAEDIAQEAFLKVWITAPSWKLGKSKFTTWFYRIVVNAGIDRYRARKPSLALEYADKIGSSENTEALAIEHEASEKISKTVNQLPEKQRTAILLCYHKELTNPEAAEIMGIHIKSLEGLLARGRQTLKEKLKYMRENI